MNRRNTTALVLALFLAAPLAMAAPGKGKGRDGKADQKKERITGDQRFAQLDINGDGVISRSEWPADHLLFDRLDRNRDNVLTTAELRRGEGEFRGRRDSELDRRGSRDAGQRHRGLDRNGDGIITREEWRGNDQSFRVRDRNGDGILSGDELRTGRGRRK